MVFIINKSHRAVIQVADHQEAVRFYGKLGWKEVSHLPEAMTSEMVNDEGVRIKLIFDAGCKRKKRNLLRGESTSLKNPKRPNAAFVIEDICSLLDNLNAKGVEILEGPGIFEGEHWGIVIQDADGNLIEFNEPLEGVPLSKGPLIRNKANSETGANSKHSLA